MKTYNLQETVIARNAHYLLATNANCSILYQEHFHPHVLSKSELREILGVISSGNFSGYLIKVNNGRILPPEDLSWVERFNLLRLYRAGISQVAYVSPQNIFNSLEMEKELQPGKFFRIRIFKKMADAVLWLDKSCDRDLKQPAPATG